MSKIEKELLQAAGLKGPKPGEKAQDYMKRLAKLIADIDDDDFNDLSKKAQKWYDKAASAINDRRPILDFDADLDADDSDDDDADEKPAKTGKTGGKKPSKDEDDDQDEDSDSDDDDDQDDDDQDDDADSDEDDDQDDEDDEKPPRGKKSSARASKDEDEDQDTDDSEDDDSDKDEDDDQDEDSDSDASADSQGGRRRAGKTDGISAGAHMRKMICQFTNSPVEKIEEKLKAKEVAFNSATLRAVYKDTHSVIDYLKEQGWKKQK